MMGRLSSHPLYLRGSRDIISLEMKNVKLFLSEELSLTKAYDVLSFLPELQESKGS